MASGVYKITNIVNTRFYIGSATNIQKRWQGHIQDLNRGVHANSHFQKAWNKYGELCFSFEVLEHCSKAEIIEREQHYLDSLTACSRGYNICPIAYSRLGTKMPINAVERIRQANKGRVPTLEARLKMSIASKGKPKFPEIRQKLSEYHKGLKASDETKMKMSIARRKRITTDETRKKLAIALSKRVMPPMSLEGRLSLSEYSKNRFFSEETRQKLSRAAKQQWEYEKQNGIKRHNMGATA